MKKLVKVVIASTVVLGLLASCATTKGAEGSSESVKTEKVKKEKPKKQKKAKKVKFNKEAYKASYDAGDYATCISMLSSKKPKKSAIKDHLDINMLQYFSGDYVTSGKGFMDTLGEMQQLSSTMTAGQKMSAALAGENSIEYSGAVYERILTYSMRAVNALKENQTDVAKGVVQTYIGDEKDTIVQLLQQQKELEASSDGLLEKDNVKNSMEVLTKFGINIPLLDWSNEKPAKAGEDDVYESSPFFSYLGSVIYAADGDFDHASDMSKVYTSSKVKGSDTKALLGETISVPAGKGHLDVIALSGTIGKMTDDAYIPQSMDLTLLLAATGQLKYMPREDAHLKLNYKIAYPSFDESKQNHQISKVVVKLSDGSSKNALLIEDFDKAVALDVKGKARGAYNRSIFRNITKSAGTLTAGVAGVVTVDQTLQGCAGDPLTFRLAYMGYEKAVQGLQKGLDAIVRTEKADVRQAAYFPHKASAAGFSVAPGMYSVTVDYLDSTGNVVKSETIENVEVKQGKVSAVVSSCEK